MYIACLRLPCPGPKQNRICCALCTTWPSRHDKSRKDCLSNDRAVAVAVPNLVLASNNLQTHHLAVPVPSPSRRNGSDHNGPVVLLLTQGGPECCRASPNLAQAGAVQKLPGHMLSPVHGRPSSSLSGLRLSKQSVVYKAFRDETEGHGCDGRGEVSGLRRWELHRHDLHVRALGPIDQGIIAKQARIHVHVCGFALISEAARLRWKALEVVAHGIMPQ
mmetsp:Transcript_27617/g.38832  ORF Transcript_27617/g.38832 Transcript_27617/m.38832 type:complete len:219 (-) Transcript_27617:366-1022(-)